MSKSVSVTVSMSYLPYVIVLISGIVYLSFRLFCWKHGVQVDEISEFLKNERHVALFYLFKLCLLVISLAFANGIRDVFGRVGRSVLASLNKKKIDRTSSPSKGR